MHLLHVFPSFQVGGSQRRFAALANHFGDRYRHSIVALDGCVDTARLLGPQVPFELVQPPPKLGTPKAIATARRMLKAIAPQRLLTYNWGAIEWAAANWFPVAPHIHIEDGFGPEEARTQLKRRVLFRHYALKRRHSTVVLPSRTLTKLALDVWRVSPDRVKYVPNGIPCDKFQQPVDPDVRKQFKGTGQIVGTVATLRKEKALERLIEAFWKVRQTTPARLVIVGDGPERLKLESLVSHHGLGQCVTFTGGLERPETVVAAFDVFAITSDTEQMPLSLLEAMAAGLPVVSTDVGDIRSMVAAENQPFIVARDTDIVAASLQHLFSDKEMRRTLGHANRARAVAEFDETQMFSQYDRLFSA